MKKKMHKRLKELVLIFNLFDYPLFFELNLRALNEACKWGRSVMPSLFHRAGRNRRRLRNGIE